jgi:hypothetical protein
MRKNHLIEQLKEHMTADLEAAIGEQEEQILSAIAKLSDDREGEEPLKFSVTLRGVLNLDKSTVETNFSFGVKTTVKGKHALDDPSQSTLPFEGHKATVSKGGEILFES